MNISKLYGGKQGIKSQISTNNQLITCYSNFNRWKSLHFQKQTNLSKKNSNDNDSDKATNNETYNPTILMIDDDDLCLSGMEITLMNTPYNLICANSGKGGISCLEMQHSKISLVLLDLMMPDMYGINVLEIIKKDERFNKIPVIIQSAVLDKIEITRAFTMGAVDFIKKPYKQVEILNAIRPLSKLYFCW